MSTRRQQLVATAAQLFAERGFSGVSVNDIGEACGISGPALYKHFRSKDELLTEALVSTSEHLVAAATDVVAANTAPADQLDELIAGHVDFSLTEPALIVIQDREWAHLPAPAQEQVRQLQREYIGIWVDSLMALRPNVDRGTAWASVQAVFGLLNSTPRSARIDRERMRDLLAQMARGALLLPAQI